MASLIWKSLRMPAITFSTNYQIKLRRESSSKSFSFTWMIVHLVRISPLGQADLFMPIVIGKYNTIKLMMSEKKELTLKIPIIKKDYFMHEHHSLHFYLMNFKFQHHRSRHLIGQKIKQKEILQHCIPLWANSPSKAEVYILIFGLPWCKLQQQTLNQNGDMRIRRQNDHEPSKINQIVLESEDSPHRHFKGHRKSTIHPFLRQKIQHRIDNGPNQHSLSQVRPKLFRLPVVSLNQENANLPVGNFADRIVGDCRQGLFPPSEHLRTRIEKDQQIGPLELLLDQGAAAELLIVPPYLTLYLCQQMGYKSGYIGRKDHCF